MAGPRSVDEAIAVATAWFEVNSGWAPPDAGELGEWLADGVCRCPDGCLVSPGSWCEHGLADWSSILAAVEHDDARRHRSRDQPR